MGLPKGYSLTPSNIRDVNWEKGVGTHGLRMTTMRMISLQFYVCGGHSGNSYETSIDFQCGKIILILLIRDY